MSTNAHVFVLACKLHTDAFRQSPEETNTYNWCFIDQHKQHRLVCVNALAIGAF